MLVKIVATAVVMVYNFITRKDFHREKTGEIIVTEKKDSTRDGSIKQYKLFSGNGVASRLCRFSVCVTCSDCWFFCGENGNAFDVISPHSCIIKSAECGYHMETA